MNEQEKKNSKTKEYITDKLWQQNDKNAASMTKQ